MERLSSNASSTAAVVPNPEVSAIPKRRKFTAQYKLDILKQVDACKDQPGAIGAILRREGLYSSLLTLWRQERDRGALEALEKKRGRRATRSPLWDEVERLRRENAELKRRLEQAETIIDVQKKISSILGIPLKHTRSDGSDS
jgi:transposase-like protein